MLIENAIKWHTLKYQKYIIKRDVVRGKSPCTITCNHDCKDYYRRSFLMIISPKAVKKRSNIVGQTFEICFASNV